MQPEHQFWACELQAFGPSGNLSPCTHDKGAELLTGRERTTLVPVVMVAPFHERASSIAQGIDRDVRPWLNLADDLRNLKLDQDISIPQIAVMGDQSSGKSSVLEALSGVPLPRGSGLTTRCPLRLIMKRAKNGEEWSARVSTSENPHKPISVPSPATLTATIERLTTSLTRNSVGFSTESIIVELVSPDAPDLTLIDLPGIVRTATQGQDSRVISKVNAMIDEYLSMERTIILAVIPSNQDIATIDILERAQKVDPNGERTIGVLTKPDLIGEGNEEEVMAVLHNTRKPLRLGYVMVKNRTQRELSEGLSASEAKQSEEAFFNRHPFFRSMDQKLFGIDHLTSRLTDLLVDRVQQALVPMKAEIETQLAQIRGELKALGTQADIKGPGDRQKLLVRLTQEYVRHLNDVIRGEYRDRLVVTHAELRLYTRALDVFQRLMQSIHASAPKFKDENFVSQLATQMEALRGRELPGFMSSQAFYMFMAQYAEGWRRPSKVAASDVRALTMDVANKLADLVIVRYPVLRETLRGVVARVLDGLLEQASKELDNLVQREKDPFTVNDFLTQHINKIRFDRFEAAVDGAFATVQANPDKWDDVKEEVGAYMQQWYRNTHGVNCASNAEDMSVILEAYWILAAKRFVDQVCMVIDRDVMGGLPSKIHEEMYRNVNDDARLQAYFEEDKQLVERRAMLLDKRDRLTKAAAAMATIQVVKRGPSRLVLQANIGPLGLGVSLAEEEGKVVVRGFRALPSGPNPAQEAGLQLGDVIEQINGEPLGCIADAVARIKESKASARLSVTRIVL